MKSKTKGTFRPWEHHEVPYGAWTRSKDRTVAGVSIIVATSKNGKIFLGSFSSSHPPAWLLEYGEHSIDQGKTWNPCGVLVN